MKAAFPALICLMLGAGFALADSGPLRDPTGCATGSAVANCRSLPPMGRARNESDLHRKEERKAAPLMPRTTTMPSELILRRPPAPGSTGLDKGSTGLGVDSGGSKKRIGH